MHEQTGRMEQLKDLAEEKPSMKGKWLELHEQEASNLKSMNRKDRRAWLAKERKAGRIFKERVIE